MPVESATYISQLSPSDPPGSDALAQGDNHIRLLKQVLQNTFPNLNAAVNLTPSQLNEAINGLYPIWRSTIYSPVFVDVNTLRVSGVDATATFFVGQRVRVVDNGITRYGTITVTAFSGGNTDFDVLVDGGASFTGPISAVTVGLGHTGKAIDASLVAFVRAITIAAAVDMSGAAFNEADRVDVASATTTNLDTAASNYVRITGTTTITGITLSNGNRRHVVFEDALTLTNGASLILPGGANITTAAGDTALVIGESGGVVRVQSYTKASGAPIVLNNTGRLLRTNFYTASTTWTKQADVGYVIVKVIGGGGGSGGVNNGSSGAGASGGCAIKKILAASLGATETVTCGAGGTAGAGASNPSSGGAGGTSSFGAHCSATGGGGGAWAKSGVGGAPGPAAGGAGSGGDVNIDGSGGTGSSGSGGIGVASMGAPAPLIGHGAAGGAAGKYGGGAGGAASAGIVAGDTGGVGVVIVEEYS